MTDRGYLLRARLSTRGRKQGPPVSRNSHHMISVELLEVARRSRGIPEFSIDVAFFRHQRTIYEVSLFEPVNGFRFPWSAARRRVLNHDTKA